MVERKVFLDTAYAIALASQSDEYHDKAIALAEQLEKQGTRLITTRAVLLEIGNALAKLQYRQAAVELLESLEQDSQITIVACTDELFSRAFELFRKRPDKEWGLTDCISFVVMQEQGLQTALTTDEHFQQASYHALLRE